MENSIICLDIAVCSSWGNRYPAHMFNSQYALKRGHQFCLNCGMSKKDARKNEEPIDYRPRDMQTLELY